MATRPSYILPAVLLACAALGPARAAELGDARVLSHIGQALLADVELSLVEDGARPVQARLAHPDVYRGANIAMPAVLSSLDIAVIRQGGKQFLHLTSSKPVESRHLHVYLELVDGGQRNVRLVTLWFTPDPHPAPPPAPVTAALPAPAAAVAEAAKAPAGAPLDKPRAVVAPRKPAPPKRRVAPPEAEAKVDAKAEAKADAGQADAQAAQVATPKPSAQVAKKGAVSSAPRHGSEEGAHAQPGPSDAGPAAVPPGAAPAACAPQPSESQAQACAVLGAKNEALRQELGLLEEKVKVLQVATGVKSATEAAAEAVSKPEEKPKEAPRIQRKPKPAAPPEEPTPWLLIAGGVSALLALAGLFVFLRRRRAAAGKVLKQAREPEVVVLPQDGAAPEANPGFMASVKARLMAIRRNRQAPQDTPETPETLDEKTIIQPE